MSNSSPLAVSRHSDAYWRATFDNPPLNLIDPETIVALPELMDTLEKDPAVKVVVFDSADPQYFIAHFDVARGGELPGPGPTGLPAWPDLATRLTRTPFVTIAEIRGRARGLGSEFALACDPRFASREKSLFGQPEVVIGLVPGGGSIEVLSALVGRFARRIATFEQPALAAAKAHRGEGGEQGGGELGVLFGWDQEAERADALV